jgi:hypothetical protein
MQLLDAADKAGDREAAGELTVIIQDWQTGENRKAAEARFGETLREQAESYNPVEAALIGAGKTFTDIGRAIPGLLGADVDTRQAEQEQALYDPLREAAPTATMLGEMAPYLATAPIGGSAGAAGATARGLAGLAGKAGLQGAQRFATGAGSQALLGTGRGLAGRVGEQAAIGTGLGAVSAPPGQAGTGAGLGGAIGGAFPLLGRGAGALAGRARGAVQAAREAGKAGVPLTLGQRIGSNLITKLEEVYSRVPGLGSAFEGVKKGQQRAINRMAAESVGETADEVTSEVLGRAATRIGNDFDEVIAGDPFQFTRGFMQTARELRRTMADELYEAPFTTRQLNKILVRAKAGGLMTANEYKKLNTRVGKKLAGQLDSDERDALMLFKDALDDMIGQQMSPSRLQRWNQARDQWRNLRTLEKVTDVEAGIVSGPKLANVLQKKSPRTFGTATDPLSRAGQYGRRLRPEVPNPGSGSAIIPWLGAGALASGAFAGEQGDPLGQLGRYGLTAMAAPWAYRAAGRMGTPIQAAAAKGLGAAARPPAISVGSRLGALTAPGLLE